MIEILNPFDKAVSYAACIGVDWGHTENCFQLLDPEINQVERIEVGADPASMGIFIRELRERFPQGKIGLVSEQSKGALVNQLLDYPFFELMAANPHAAAKFRRSLHPAGSKTDPIDSSALLRMIFTHRDRMTMIIRGDEVSRRVSAALSSDPLLEELGELQLANYVEQLSVLNKQIQQLDKQLRKAFSKHPDKEIFKSLPGAGPTMAPRLAAAFSCDRDRYQSCSQLQAYSGIAPIKLQSGNREYTFMRRFCSKFLRQSFHEWAGLSAQYSPWAKACYMMFRERGKGVGKAKRALAFKWMRILFRCWKNNQPYDELTYVRSLIKHNSPVVDKMKELGFIDDENNILFA